MMTFRPRSLFSWNFSYQGPGLEGIVAHSVWGESGSLHINGQDYTVTCKGFFEKEWFLYRGEQVVAKARKAGFFGRKLEIHTPRETLLLVPDGFGRPMRLTGPGHEMRFAPLHAFTRQGEGRGSYREAPVAIFTLWLTTLLWRRAARSSSPGGAGS
ncbi:hypothetical protein [Roseibacillus ishigakijimensis]|uniref:Uncharacterized protein n=1 Tax=Roseibacillus ishigakijimensis TaxID=454146 RepID=A0A934VMA5_9BACT|nr:hypothetical protein [Roseibacillus ishigakijimensis]MBK1834077.1 hypothetical protein [Roseibacillus ishigakijimensis]